MLAGLSTLGFWITFVSPVLRTSCHSYSMFQCSWAVAVAVCGSWFWTMGGVYLTALSFAATGAIWDSQKSSKPQRWTWIHLASCTSYVHTLVQYAFCTFVKIYSDSVGFHSLHICTCGRIFFHLLLKAAYGSPGEPWSLFILANVLFPGVSPPRAEASARRSHTALAVTVKECCWGLCHFLVIVF